MRMRIRRTTDLFVRGALDIAAAVQVLLHGRAIEVGSVPGGRYGIETPRELQPPAPLVALGQAQQLVGQHHDDLVFLHVFRLQHHRPLGQPTDRLFDLGRTPVLRLKKHLTRWNRHELLV